MEEEIAHAPKDPDLLAQRLRTARRLPMPVILTLTGKTLIRGSEAVGGAVLLRSTDGRRNAHAISQLEDNELDFWIRLSGDRDRYELKSNRKRVTIRSSL
jgi:hypothetical protein